MQIYVYVPSKNLARKGLIYTQIRQMQFLF